MLLLLLLTNAFVLLPWAGAGRIIGGREVKPHSRPYMAHLKIQRGSQTSYCGGFLIRPDAVLSAAHCVDKEGRVRVTVTLGAHNARGRERSQQKIRVGQWVTHPKYSRVGLKNDIVLLKLKPKARINKNVQSISIPRRNDRVREGALCNVPGWGWTSDTGNTTNVLREVKLKVQNATVCQQIFRYYERQSMLCVGDESSPKATSRGDSGGPLVCNRKAHGIVSHARERNLFPSVFTKISYFEPWIREQLRRFALQDIPGSPSSG
ncbi:cathepsin G-like isoform X2 [Motacilla alba alba]|uniref:cathepsin G-like isoform X2 n=1 Tax=Motacilla alba alba TaxID=1094192 RepID=UPI0018D4E175|nr:cathepsin G-like isoform X2 [Motacilla alba alba]